MSFGETAARASEGDTITIPHSLQDVLRCVSQAGFRLHFRTPGYFCAGLSRSGSEQLRNGSTLPFDRTQSHPLDQAPSCSSPIGSMSAFWRSQEARFPTSPPPLSQSGVQGGRRHGGVDSSGIGAVAARLQRMLSEEAAAADTVRRLGRPPHLLPTGHTPRSECAQVSATSFRIF